MKYFLLERDENFINAPEIINWFKQVDEKLLHKGSYHKLDERTAIKIKSNKNVEFPDVISYPFLLITKDVKKVLELYSPNTNFKVFMLYETKFGINNQYYLPTLDEIDCLHQNSIVTIDKSAIKKIVLDKTKLKDQPLFFISGVSKRYAIARMDFIESILRKDVHGIQLTEVEVM